MKLECHEFCCGEISREVDLEIENNQVSVIKCLQYEKGEKYYSCKKAINSTKRYKCLFDELPISQLELYNKSSIYIKSMTKKCNNCGNLTLSTLVGKESKEIPEGLTRGRDFLWSQKILCSDCNGKMENEIDEINKKYNL